MNPYLSIISDQALEAEYIRRNCRQPGELMDNGKAAARHIKGLLLKEKHREQFVVLYLSASLNLIASEVMFTGTISASAIYPREIVRRALELSAASCIIGHNHPSGNIKPSDDDIDITQEIVKSLGLLAVTLVDHIIIGHGQKDYFSMAEQGLLPCVK